MVEDRLLPQDRPLVMLHNLGIVEARVAKNLNELARLLLTNTEELKTVLSNHEKAGYVRSLVKETGDRFYYLTGLGILKVCSSFS